MVRTVSVAKRRATQAAAEQIGESVSVWRRAQHLTQAELAQRSHTSPRTIAKIEAGDATVQGAVMLLVGNL